jgi:acyl carrier protein
MTMGDSDSDFDSDADPADVVVAALAAEVGLIVDQIDTSRRLARIPGMESVKILHAVVRIEDHFEIIVPDDFLIETATVADLIDLVARLVKDSR